MLNDSASTLPLKPAVCAAVERHWPDLQRAARSILGDESLAAEIMESAITRAVAYLVDHPPEDQEDVSAALSRFCRSEVARRRKQRSRLVFVDFSSASHPSSSDAPLSVADAAIDAEKILRDAAPAVREAIMLRYGSLESWSDVAIVTAGSPAAIRMRCKRFLDRIRRELGSLGASQ
jgi:DNA-directed RNA polymerase specialized sigma24 family protein